MEHMESAIDDVLSQIPFAEVGILGVFSLGCSIKVAVDGFCSKHILVNAGVP